MVEVLVVLDGASEPLTERPTSLELARTPTLDRLATTGRLARVQTTPSGLSPGSETAIPGLLGWVPTAPVDRGRMEAAGRGIPIGDASSAWRVDAVDDTGRRADLDTTADVARTLRDQLPDHRVEHLSGHRLLVVGERALPTELPSNRLRVWPAGAIPPRVLDASTTMIAARGAAAGIAALMGASVVTPDTATGGPDTDLDAKLHAALTAVESAATVVVHVGAPDEAAHTLDPDLKIWTLERIDRELLTPLIDDLSVRDATVRVMPDHGADPRTGLHDAEPVPCVTWSARSQAKPHPRRLTERAVRGLDLEPTQHPAAVCA
jgi:2,3-bisphosphoglycerate-independent phosphoglycerate mutase